MLWQDINVGYCCNEYLHAKTNCRAISSHMCSGKQVITDKFLREHAKYAYCPFDGNKCGTGQREVVSGFSKQGVRTSVAMGSSDVCPYVLKSETLLQKNSKFKLETAHLQESRLVILSG